MSISRDELKHIALLSRLELSEEERIHTRDIAEILDYVEKLEGNGYYRCRTDVPCGPYV